MKKAVRAKINIGLTLFQEVDGGCLITSVGTVSNSLESALCLELAPLFSLV